MEEPCVTCDRKDLCRSGCRCQALAIKGSATQADPSCSLSPYNGALRGSAVCESAAGEESFAYRRIEA
jgi:pyrroloquinoline quinone biosynthesis protein E